MGLIHEQMIENKEKPNLICLQNSGGSD